MKIDEIWKMKSEVIERIRQEFIKDDGDDSDFDYDTDPRVRITEFNDDTVNYESLDGHMTFQGESLENFFEEYEREYS